MAWATSVPAQLTKANVLLKTFGLLQIPLIGFVRPRLVAVDEEQSVVRVPLDRRTRNHLRSMYFGALAIGADLAAGWAAMEAMQEAKRTSGRRVDFVFKDVQAEFLRRPDGDVDFTCRDGRTVRAMVDDTLASGERVEQTVSVVATVPDRTGDEPVARFRLTLSVKARPTS